MVFYARLNAFFGRLHSQIFYSNVITGFGDELLADNG